MTDITDRQHFAVSRPDTGRPAADRRDAADAAFLRRILIGLVAATVVSGAVTLALTTQQEMIEGLQVASTHGPA